MLPKYRRPLSATKITTQCFTLGEYKAMDGREMIALQIHIQELP